MLLFDVLELEGISFWVTSWVSSAATSNLRATARTAVRLVVRHAPVSTLQKVYLEALKCPEIPSFPPYEALYTMNASSPLRAWCLQSTDCYRLCHRDAPDFCRSMGRRLFCDREFVLALAAKHGPRALQYADERLKGDREVVLAAINQNGSTLEYANPKFKRDRDVVLAAVRRCGSALKYADPSLKCDKEVVKAAVAQSSWALTYADESLRNELSNLPQGDAKPSAWRSSRKKALPVAF